MDRTQKGGTDRRVGWDRWSSLTLTASRERGAPRIPTRAAHRTGRARGGAVDDPLARAGSPSMNRLQPLSPDTCTRNWGVDASSIVLLAGVKRAPEDRVGVGSCPRDQVIDLLGDLSVGSAPVHGRCIQDIHQEETVETSDHQLGVVSIAIGVSRPRDNGDERSLRRPRTSCPSRSGLTSTVRIQTGLP